MSDRTANAIDRKKEFLIEKLLGRGIYKRRNHQLYELSVKELENEYRKSCRAN
ncbi:Fur-regulated basic protein FbpA [Sporolactobacillus sp. THM19-2]|uniref:Fur-regulated basic protein FbpA n=1 Tax=Sporolactobacillus sp. THM19-2 TaxID=2511171 RepID=UPI001021D222|nr:Fur-regulated basic protein FbpA [Sporolactobacillus sp. THM19-2]RYL90288.1 Fur-regulated basic protein FbpA [Sporolactobacillus sp. THM19-2]